MSEKAKFKVGQRIIAVEDGSFNSYSEWGTYIVVDLKKDNGYFYVRILGDDNTGHWIHQSKFRALLERMDKLLFPDQNGQAHPLAGLLPKVRTTLAAKDAEIARLRELLRPFAQFAALIDSSSASSMAGDPCPLTLNYSKVNDGTMASLGDCRRARATLEQKP